MHEGEKEHTVVGPNAEEPKGSFWDAIRRFFKRILFHISAFIIGAILSTHVPQIHPGEAALGVYLGLICIVARGASRKPSWLVPAVSGAGLAVLLILFGMPFPYALFWGGLQSWVQRLLVKSFRMGTEWVPFSLLLIMAFSVRQTLSLPLAMLFCALLAGGQGVLWALARKRAAELAPKPKPEPKPEPAPSPDEPASMKASRTSLAELECKLPGLPAETQASVRAIMQSANNILGCMATDPRDVDHGARFLKRYLAATHGIVDTHLRFAHDKDISPDVASALARSNDMLARLKVAFAKEHALLLQNDVTDFSADLKTLDTLLKMDGN